MTANKHFLRQQAIQDLRLNENLKTICMAAISKKSESIIHARSVAYYLAMENIASLKYGSLLDFVDFLDVGVGNMRVGGNATYSSRASVEEFQDCIATVIESELMQKVRSSPFICILIDESTDMSNTKKLVIYARIIEPTLFVSTTHFIGNVSVEGQSHTA